MIALHIIFHNQDLFSRDRIAYFEGVLISLMTGPKEYFHAVLGFSVARVIAYTPHPICVWNTG